MIHGMLAGIGILIILGQFHVMLDVDIPGGGIENLLAIPAVLWRAITRHDDLTHDEAALIGVMTLVIVVVWDKLETERFRKLPGPLMGAVFAASLAAVLDLPIRYVALPENLTELLVFPNWDWMSNGSAVFHAAWIAGFVLFLPDLLGLGPTSSLAAILIYIGMKLINPEAVLAPARFGRWVMFVFAATVVGIVAIDRLRS